MKRLLTVFAAACTVLTLTAAPASAASLKFDDQLGAAGSVSYSGTTTDGIVGTSIKIDSILGVDTALNDGVSLSCVCTLNFVTGTVSEDDLIAPSLDWSFEGGGTFTITGDIAALGIVGGDIVSGTFLGGSVDGNTLINSLTFSSLGTDTKHPDLLDYFGLGTDFIFVHSELALNSAIFNLTTGSFTGTVSNTDFNNLAVQPVPEPGSLFLLGSSLLGLAGAARRRMKNRKNAQQ